MGKIALNPLPSLKAPDQRSSPLVEDGLNSKSFHQALKEARKERRRRERIRLRRLGETKLVRMK